MVRPEAKIPIPLRTIPGILDLKEAGESNKDIGARFGVSERTIDRRIERYKKEMLKELSLKHSSYLYSTSQQVSQTQQCSMKLEYMIAQTWP
jgi:transposase